jgi:serine/threonine-protein kinase
MDRQGRGTPIRNAPLEPYDELSLSPDDSRVVFIRGASRKVATWSFASDRLTPVTLGTGTETGPVWTPDGNAIVFGSTRAGTVFNLYRQASDGSGSVERLTTSGSQQYSSDVLPDGSRVLGSETRNTGGVIMLFPSRAEGSVAPETILQQGSNPRLSPNGRFLAYESTESGRREIFVRPFPRVDDGRWQISTAGGARVRWSGNGRELFYLDESDAMMAVSTETGGAGPFRASGPVKLFDASFARANDVLTYDVSADGQRFLMAKPEARSTDRMPTTLVVVTNCFNAFMSAGNGR